MCEQLTVIAFKAVEIHVKKRRNKRNEPGTCVHIHTRMTAIGNECVPVSKKGISTTKDTLMNTPTRDQLAVIAV